MSHWGKGTGYDYSNERVGFLNQSISSQRRIAMQALARPSLGFTPLGTPRALMPLGPLTAPIQRDDLYTSNVLSTAVNRNSARRLGQLPSTASFGESSSSLSSTSSYGAQRSCSSLAYERPTSAFRRTFGAVDRTNGKPRDGTTQFREQIFGLWNITGAKSPASFRP